MKKYYTRQQEHEYRMAALPHRAELTKVFVLAIFALILFLLGAGPWLTLALTAQLAR